MLAKISHTFGRNSLWLLICVAYPVLTGCGSDDQPDARTPPSLPNTKDLVASEIAKISGKWTVLAEYYDGRPEKPGRQFRYTFKNDQMTTELEGKILGTVRFHLDPTTDPKTLDTMIMNKGEEEVTKGIYAVDGDVLRISYTALGDRPTDFVSRDRDETMVVILQRVKD